MATTHCTRRRDGAACTLHIYLQGLLLLLLLPLMLHVPVASNLYMTACTETSGTTMCSRRTRSQIMLLP